MVLFGSMSGVPWARVRWRLPQDPDRRGGQHDGGRGDDRHADDECRPEPNRVAERPAEQRTDLPVR